MGCKMVGLMRYYTRWGVIEIGNVQKMHVAFFYYKLRVGRMKELIVAKKQLLLAKFLINESVR